MLTGGLSRLLPGRLHDWIHLGPILADALLALLVFHAMRVRGAGARAGVAGAAAHGAEPA